MASHLPGLRWFTNAYRLSSLLLGISACLLTLTTIPPSSVLYLTRVDYGGGNATTVSTAWFSSLGYCTSSSELLIHCTTTSTKGYSIERILSTSSSSPSNNNISTVLTRTPTILHPIAIILSLLSLACYQSIIRRPTATKYVISIGSSLLALLMSAVAFVFQCALASYLASGYYFPSSSFKGDGVNIVTAKGPLAYAMMLALAAQLAACTVGFYSCIGGKYECEGGIRLGEEGDEEEGLGLGLMGEEEESLSQGDVDRDGCDDEESLVDEKQGLL